MMGTIFGTIRNTSRLRKPRDLASYRSAAESALWLRQFANQIEGDAAKYPLVRVHVEWWNWNPDWQKKKGKAQL